ncbi:menaquinone dependent protoporphyrinogen IX dehydrogenase [Pasteurella multocida]|nr:menaquinone dependent protoporphyrinogen IX dehydrogenase [Pasteurella multocida]
MKTLILYSSRDGQTKKIAEFIASKLSGDVQTQPLTEKTDITKADRIVIGASIRYGHFDKVLDKFVKKTDRTFEPKAKCIFCS